MKTMRGIIFRASLAYQFEIIELCDHIFYLILKKIDSQLKLEKYLDNVNNINLLIGK